CEPLDWALTANEIANDPWNPLSYIGFLPFIPAAAGRICKKADDVAEAAGKAAGKADGVRSANSTPASSVNAGAALNSKLGALEKAQREAARVRQLPDGRIRYYNVERPATNPGPTRGNSYVTEWDPATGRV